MRHVVAGVVLALFGCSDDVPGLSLEVRIPAPVPAPTDVPTDQPSGICPPDKSSALPLGNGQVDLLRFTVISHEPEPRFLCDRTFGVPSGNQTELLMPDQAAVIDVLLDAYGPTPVGGGARPLLFTGEQRGVLASGGTARILMLRPLQFGCLPAHLGQTRAFHTATALPDGEVVVAGGVVQVADPLMQTLSATETIEIYDPATRTFFSPVDNRPVKKARAMHQARLLTTQPPYVIMLIGGVTTPDAMPPATPIVGLTLARGEPFRVIPLAVAEAATPEFVVYDPGTRTVSTDVAQRTYTPRMLGATTVDPGPLPEALILGGTAKVNGAAFMPVLSIERSDKGGNPIPPAGMLSEPRIGATVTPLDTARALVYGGDVGAAAGQEALHASEVVTGIGTTSVMSTVAPIAMGSSLVPTAFHTATPLADGSIAIIGGYVVSSGTALSTNDAAPLQRLQVAADGTVTSMALPAGGFVGVGFHETTFLSDVNLLLVSGGNPNMATTGCGVLCSSQAAYLIDPATVQIKETHALEVARYGHQQTRLPDGTVLVSGGLRYDPGNHDTTTRILDAVELFEPHDVNYDRANLLKVPANRMPAAEADHTNPALPRCLTRDEYKMMHP